MPMKCLKLIFFTLALSASVAFAQTVQRGVVVEYNAERKPTPLSNVEIVVANAGSTVTNEKGEFTLRFRQLKPGDRVIVRRILKVGYEVFNTEAVEQWYISGDDTPFTIELCKSAYLQNSRNQLIGQADKKLVAQFEKDKKQLSIDLKHNTISAEEYEKRLSKLTRDYENKLSNIDTYIDRFVRIDLSSLDDNEKKIMAYVKEGDYDKAIELYDKEHLIHKLMQQDQNLKRFDEASAQFTQKEKELNDVRNQIRNSVFRQIDLLRMQGGEAAHDKITGLYRDLAMADTTNTLNMLYYGRQLASQADYDGAMLVYKTIGNVAKRENDSVNLLRAECYQAKQLILLGHLTEGITMMEHSLPLFEKLRVVQSDTMSLLYDEADFRQILGTRYAMQSRYDMAHQQYSKAYAHLRSLRNEANNSAIESQYAAFLVQSAANMSRSKWGDHSIQNIQEGIRVLEGLYTEKPYYYEARLAFAYGNLGMVCTIGDNLTADKIELAESSFQQCIQHYKSAVERFPAAYNRFYASQLSNLGEFYIRLKQYDRALECLKESKDAWMREPDVHSLKYAHRLSNVHYNLGNCYYFLHDLQNALKYDQIALDEMEPLYKMEPDTYRERMGTRLLHLCNTYKALKEYEKAFSFVQRAMEVDPSYPETQATYKELKELLGK